MVISRGAKQVTISVGTIHHLAIRVAWCRLCGCMPTCLSPSLPTLSFSFSFCLLHYHISISPRSVTGVCVRMAPMVFIKLDSLLWLTVSRSAVHQQERVDKRKRKRIGLPRAVPSLSSAIQQPRWLFRTGVQINFVVNSVFQSVSVSQPPSTCMFVRCLYQHCCASVSVYLSVCPSLILSVSLFVFRIAFFSLVPNTLCPVRVLSNHFMCLQTILL